MTLSAVVVGCGRIGSLYDIDDPSGAIRTHANAYVSCQGVELVAGVDPSAERRRTFEKGWKVRAYPDIDALLRTVRPEIWSVSTPSDQHVRVARRAVSEGARAIWCEKPIATDPTEAAELVAEARRAHTVFAVNYIRRWDAAHRAVAERISSGSFGTLESAVVLYTRGLRNYGTHAIDLLRWFFGEPSWVYGRPGRDREAPDPSPSVLIGIGDAVAALIPVSAAAYDLFEVDLLGTRERITISDLGRKVDLKVVSKDAEWGEPRVLGPSDEKMPPGLGAPMLAAVRDIVASVRDQRDPACRGEDGLEALRIAEAIARSVVSREPQGLS